MSITAVVYFPGPCDTFHLDSIWSWTAVSVCSPGAALSRVTLNISHIHNSLPRTHVENQGGGRENNAFGKIQTWRPIEGGGARQGRRSAGARRDGRRVRFSKRVHFEELKWCSLLGTHYSGLKKAFILLYLCWSLPESICHIGTSAVLWFNVQILKNQGQTPNICHFVVAFFDCFGHFLVSFVLYLVIFVALLLWRHSRFHPFFPMQFSDRLKGFEMRLNRQKTKQKQPNWATKRKIKL